MAKQHTVIVTLNDTAAKHMTETTRALEAAGLTITSSLGFLGQVTGQCSEQAAASLRSVPGVVAVERSGSVSVGPPGSETQ